MQVETEHKYLMESWRLILHYFTHGSYKKGIGNIFAGFKDKDGSIIEKNWSQCEFTFSEDNGCIKIVARLVTNTTSRVDSLIMKKEVVIKFFQYLESVKSNVEKLRRVSSLTDTIYNFDTQSYSSQIGNIVFKEDSIENMICLYSIQNKTTTS